MLKALKGMFAGADKPAEDDDERDASGKPKVTLAKALRRGWLEVFYQPKVSLQTGHMVGAEGLIRARHPELGVLGPGAFLPGAGEPEMLQMTEQVIATALRDW
ncbi:MAG TPA: EAL domain-containing protein, partial [Xanthobacteraceae bacterium]|nr:EAL domain-containing protein [Xanthobacteraceae bacterium]